MRKILTLLAMLSILISPVVAMDNQSIQNNTIYRTLVSQHDGFYAVYQVYNTLIKTTNYQNNTLNISRGDTMVWISNAFPDEMLTIISKENLWDQHSGALAWSNKEFTYVFNQYGIYEVYVKEYPKFRQKIIVGPLEPNTTNVTDVNSVKPNTTNVTDVNSVKPNTTNVIDVNSIKPNSTDVTDINNAANINNANSRLTIVLALILLSIFVLSGRIKDD